MATAAYGTVVITDVSGEIVDPEEIAEHHPAATEEHVWAGWRPSTLDELVHTWPARSEPGEYERLRGWWSPTLDELREARRVAKSRERRKSESGGAARRGADAQSVFEMIATETSLDRTSEDGQRLAAMTLRLYEQGVKDPHSLKIMVETARGIFTSGDSQQQAL